MSQRSTQRSEHSTAGDAHIRVCTICEAMCSLEIQHENGRVTSIRGDEQSTFSRGHICPKAVALQHPRTVALLLSRPLLLVHGITDDNVHFAHTLALVEHLYIAAKRAEVITLSATHMVPDPKLSLAKEQTQIDFFREHL